MGDWGYNLISGVMDPYLQLVGACFVGVFVFGFMTNSCRGYVKSPRTIHLYKNRSLRTTESIAVSLSPKKTSHFSSFVGDVGVSVSFRDHFPRKIDVTKAKNHRCRIYYIHLGKNQTWLAKKSCFGKGTSFPNMAILVVFILKFHGCKVAFATPFAPAEIEAIRRSQVCSSLRVVRCQCGALVGSMFYPGVSLFFYTNNRF